MFVFLLSMIVASKLHLFVILRWVGNTKSWILGWPGSNMPYGFINMYQPPLSFSLGEFGGPKAVTCWKGASTKALDSCNDAIHVFWVGPSLAGVSCSTTGSRLSRITGRISVSRTLKRHVVSSSRGSLVYLLNVVWCRRTRRRGTDMLVSWIVTSKINGFLCTAFIPATYCFLGGYIIPITYHKNQNNPLKRLRFWCCCDKSPDDGVDAVHMMPAMLDERKQHAKTFRNSFRLDMFLWEKYEVCVLFGFCLTCLDMFSLDMLMYF